MTTPSSSPQKAPLDMPTLTTSFNSISQIDGQSEKDDDDLEEGEVPDSDEECSVVNIVKSTSKSKKRIVKRMHSSSSSDESFHSPPLSPPPKKKHKRSPKSPDMDQVILDKPRSKRIDVDNGDLASVVHPPLDPRPIAKKGHRIPAPNSKNIFTYRIPKKSTILEENQQAEDHETADKNIDEQEDNAIQFHNTETFDSDGDEEIMPAQVEAQENIGEENEVENEAPEDLDPMLRQQKRVLALQKVHPLQHQIDHLANAKICISALEMGTCGNETTCSMIHDFADVELLYIYFHVIRDQANIFRLPGWLKNDRSKRTIERILSTYHHQWQNLKTKHGRVIALQFMNIVLQDIKDLPDAEDKILTNSR